MAGQFALLIMESKPVSDVADLWSDAIFRQILQQVAYEAIADIDPADVREMTVMALQDLPSVEAAEAVLSVLAGGLSAGQRRSLAQEMKAQRMWEEYANPAYHRALFAATALLHEAFPKTYPRADIARLILQVTAGNGDAAQLLTAPTPALALRLLAAGMDEHSTLRRLYGDALDRADFAEAGSIVWLVRVRGSAGHTADWVVYGSKIWLGPLQAGQSFAAEIKTE